MEFVLLKERQEADRKRIEAKGIADFQTIVAAGISEQLLRWKGIEATEKIAASPNTKVVIVGAGNLGQALVAYRGFASRGFEVVGLLDAHPDVVGQVLGSTEVPIAVSPMSALEPLVASGRAHIGVVATPAEAAQDVCDRLVSAGIRSILNFAPAVLTVPEAVEVRKVDLAVELQILAFHEQRRAEMQDPSMDPESLGEAIYA